MELPYILQTEEDRPFARVDLVDGCWEGIYGKKSLAYIKRAKKNVVVIPTALPPVDLVAPKLYKLGREQTPAMLLILKWPRKPWFFPAMVMAHRVQEFDSPSDEVREAQHLLNPS